ncbi:uncharacterized protein LOC132637675 [Lycium barbarum]|uniref:uncharacterized protein LOC132637675 n=1 Tax=Lycium barbarum TaxID=112863 RepID=UPI00293F1934|nr:uncharacterized protein LOC132637675 [Lycium barbarum]
MLYLPKYNGTTDPQKHVTSYTCAVKGNDMQPDKIESILLEKFGKTQSKGAMAWCSLLPEHSINSFEMLADAFIKAHAEAKKLLKNGHLREFFSDRAKENYGKNRDSSKQEVQIEPLHVINVITDGPGFTGTSFVAKKDKFSVTRERRSRSLIQKRAITFTDEDAKDITSSHNDALVISIMINYFRVKNVWVDPGSLTNVIQWRVIEQLAMMGELTPSARILRRFYKASKTTKGEIMLTVNAGGVIKHTRFYIVDGGMRYNAIFSRPWIHDMKAVPSILHRQI